MTTFRFPMPAGREAAGPHLFRRLGPSLDRQQAMRECGLWSADWDDFGTLDFTSSDRLQLATEPVVIAAAAAALAEHGFRDGGYASRPSRELEQALAVFLATEHVVLFSSTEAASMGTFGALLQPNDHVVLDERAHALLRASATAAARSIHLHAHLDVA
ncbi:MAG: hypothetical protein FJX57_19225, partial [Alphaproteobacteria bacterium]|nr:hypothetical protein [Alphaproteobacteria bacterium]